jgi:hypothetical protein
VDRTEALTVAGLLIHPSAWRDCLINRRDIDRERPNFVSRPRKSGGAVRFGGAGAPLNTPPRTFQTVSELEFSEVRNRKTSPKIIPEEDVPFLTRMVCCSRCIQGGGGLHTFLPPPQYRKG